MRRSVIAAIVSGQLCAFCGAARSGVVDSIPGLRLWLDAGAIVGLADGDPVTIWADSSAHGNNAVAMLGLPVPSYVANVPELNNKPVVRFGVGTSGVLEFEDVSNVGTVFWVLKKDAQGVNASKCLLSDDDRRSFASSSMDMISPPFYGTQQFPGVWQGMSWPPEYDPAANLTTGNSDLPYYNKLAELNGHLVDGTVTQLPVVYSILMEVPYGRLDASRVGHAATGAGWEGDMAEIVVYDRQLSEEEIREVGSYLVQKYGLAGTAYGGVMKWDGTRNDWGTAHWTAASPPPPPGTDFPNQWIHAVMENTGGTAVCSVADADRSAASLTMIGGTDAANSNRLAIAANRTFTIAGRLDAGADWNYVTLGDNARLRFGQIGTVNSSIWTLEIKGDATVENAGNAPIASLDDTWQPGMPQRTFVKQGSGTLRMDNSGGTVQAAHTTFRIEQGTVQVGGRDPLGGSITPVQLAGGSLSIKAPVTDYLPGLNHGALYSYYDRNDPNPQNLPRDPLGPSITESADEPPWADYITFVYSGEIFLPDDGSGTATVSFFEEVDDTTYLAIDGQTVLNNVDYHDRSAATVTLKSGWRSFELRVSNGFGAGGLPSHSQPLGLGYAVGDTGGKPDGLLFLLFNFA